MDMSTDRYKPPLDPTIARLVSGLDEDSREFFEERAGILEYDAGFSREKAESLAWEETQGYRSAQLQKGNARRNLGDVSSAEWQAAIKWTVEKHGDLLKRLKDA